MATKKKALKVTKLSDVELMETQSALHYVEASIVWKQALVAEQSAKRTMLMALDISPQASMDVTTRAAFNSLPLLQIAATALRERMARGV